LERRPGEDDKDREPARGDSEEPQPASSEATADPIRHHVRGSALLLSGRGLSLLLNFTTQVVVVGYLSKLEYGALSFVLALAQSGGTLNLFGFQKTIPRFLPMYEERHEYGKMYGAMALAMTSLFGIGLVVVLVVHLCSGFIGGVLRTDPLTVSLLVALIVLLPVEAYDSLLVQFLAVFAGARAIFLRRHILGPGLRLAAVGAVILAHGSVFTLAAGYLAASVVGIVLYTGLLLQVLHRKSLLRHLDRHTIEVPAREIVGFSLPLLTSDLLFVARSSLVVVILEYFHPTTAVAEYRAIIPVARLNTLVQVAFLPLFVPLAARLFSRGDRSGVQRMHRQTSVWVLVLSFPIVAACVGLARPVTVTLFGERYENSAAVLAVLAAGTFLYATLAFNVETMKVLGKPGFIAIGDILATGAAVGSSLLLIPRFGAFGAGMAVTATFVVHGIANQILLWRASGIHLLDLRFCKALALVVLGVAVVAAVEWTLSPPLPVGLAVVAALTLALVARCRSLLKLEGTFPELQAVPVLGRLFRSSSIG